MAEKKVIEALPDGTVLRIVAVVSQGEEEGFFLVKREGSPDGPIMTKAIDLGVIQIVARPRGEQAS